MYNLEAPTGYYDYLGARVGRRGSLFSASMIERDSDPRRMRPAACPCYNSTSCWGRGLSYQEQSWKKRNEGTQPELDQEASNETQAMSDSAVTYQHNKQTPVGQVGQQLWVTEQADSSIKSGEKDKAHILEIKQI